MTETLTITRPDDWHLHLRDGTAMAAVLPATAAQFARAIVMPNLKPPVTTAAAATAYRERIVAALPNGADFTPLMTLYLTDKLPPDEIRRAKAAGVVAVKLYPAGATTNSDAGVTDIRKTTATLEAMQREGLLLLVHGEVTDNDIDIFDREAVFIERVMQPLRRDFPELKVVFEHITTQQAALYVTASDRFTAATYCAASRVVTCSNTTRSSGKSRRSGCITRSMNTASRSKTSMSPSVTSPCTSSSRPSRCIASSVA